MADEIESTHKRDKMQQDLSNLVAEQLPPQQALAKVLASECLMIFVSFSLLARTAAHRNREPPCSGKDHTSGEEWYSMALSLLLVPQAEDAPSTTKVAIAIIRLAYEARDWNLLNQELQVLAKRRGQLRTVRF